MATIGVSSSSDTYNPRSFFKIRTTDSLIVDKKINTEYSTRSGITQQGIFVLYPSHFGLAQMIPFDSDNIEEIEAFNTQHFYP